ncbi:MAG: hypothetical protein WCG50_13475 [Rhodoferax sp.]
MKIIPEVLDLIDALTDIAASFKPHDSETEKCKIVLPKRAPVLKPPSRAPQAPVVKTNSSRVPKKRGWP